ncbi:amino acid--[acyl-carrier-protein] ligase [Cupriavidus gilardii]|uniref:Amino acid--[acyl-carrier-protein] ligase n=1 Tax=Cupriavidus gilardii TaxID=82541 RepID=A0ABY4VIM2_9BURK|nr:amino acid--[acyl-carrier-protein] ligase [Cupriavidus gilardii]MCT9117651.1 amino acid--[acyl-carrier-protein] ligase [Cupriavidus gilardii]USE76811.1 amino acid--[acyl-carrier-protein] ligase [Cupriavidus gilardii]
MEYQSGQQGGAVEPADTAAPPQRLSRPPEEAALAAQRRFRQALIEAGLLIPTGVDGLYGRSADFEAIADGLNAAIGALGADQQAEVMRFPPAMARQDFEASEYLKSFPQLAGTVHSFCGSDRDHHRLLARLDAGEEWADQQRPTRVVLTPAACYPVYPVIAARGALPPQGRVVDVLSYCFRHEPSVDPARMQLFRMREYVRLGTAEQIVAFRTQWIERGSALARQLALPWRLDLANDPFFGRGGKIVADGQREQKLKFELLIPIHDDAPPTACMSFNYHKDHFAEVWPLRTADGGRAHTGCVGFGIDRLILALLRHHGFALARWPGQVRELLGLRHV